MNIDNPTRNEPYEPGSVRSAPSSKSYVGSESADSSTSGLISSLVTDVGELMRGEMRLARAEMNSSINGIKTGLVSLGTGVAVLLAGVLTLIAFLVLGVADWFDLQLWLGALIIGAIATIAGVLMIKGGSSKMSVDSLIPSRTEQALRKDTQTIKEHVS